MPNHGQVRGADSLEKMKKLEVTMTSGRGQFSMEFSQYAPCPASPTTSLPRPRPAKKSFASNPERGTSFRFFTASKRRVFQGPGGLSISQLTFED